jgi:hypothetical protein
MSRMMNAVLTDCRVIEVAASRHFVAKYPHLETPGFDFYWASHRELFYETLELQTLVVLMTTFKKLKELAAVKDMDIKELAARIQDNVNEVRTLNLEPFAIKRVWQRINPKARMRRGIRTSAWLKGKSTLQDFGSRDGQ